MPRSRKPARRKSKPARKAKLSDKFIVGMVVTTNSGTVLRMLPEPIVFDNYDNALKHAHEKYAKYPNAKWVVFAKVTTVGAPFLAPKVETWRF